jgi:hypothetical protein
MLLHESVQFDIRQVNQLRELVAQGEFISLEFKRKATHPEKILREFIAFANTKGGVLLVGVGDDKTIPGLKHPEDESYVIHTILKSGKPGIECRETFIPLENSRTIIRYDIPESRHKLHYFINSENIAESFVRVGDRTIRASREVREILKREQRKRDIRFHYGEHEQFLMKYLDAKPYITLHEFMKFRRIRKFIASRKLVLLVLANVLRVTPHEKGDQYSLAFGLS